MNKNKKYLIVIAGPTAVGKTNMAIELAQLFETVIVSADSRQFYQELEIGTAKPNAEELSQATHYFINNLSIHDNYDVGKYEKEATALLNKLFLEHDVIVLTGGSGLYIKALLEGIDDMPEVPAEVRAKWNQLYAEKGLGFLQEALKQVDPDYFEQVDKQNHIRLIRALEVHDASGKNMTAWRAASQPAVRDFKAIKIVLNRDREELYERIDLRMDLMIQEGLFEESKAFHPYQHLNALQTVGYTEIFGYFDGAYDREEAIRLLKRNSRRYAKRQLTWFNADDRIKWYNVSSKAELYELIPALTSIF